MATLASVVAKQRQSGKGVLGSLSGGVKEKLKETFDPRRMINQNGLMAALFPKLKAYKAKGADTSNISFSQPSLDISSVESSLERIQSDTRIEAKNSMVFPMMHRDLNLMRQNIIKLVKLEGGTPRLKADAFFMSAKDRQKAYEAQSIKPTKKKTNTEGNKSSHLFLITTGLLLVGGYILKELDILNKETIKNAIENFVTILTGSSKAEAAINRTPESGGVLQQLHGITFKDLNETQQKAFLQKQFESEGAVSGNIAKDLNNPGAMVYSPWQKQYGGEPGKTVTGPDGVTRTFAKFPSLEKGKEAQLALWKSDTYANLPLDEALRKWVAPANTPEAQLAFNQYANRGLQAIQSSGPMPGVSSGFGTRKDPFTGATKMHGGVDIPAPAGTDVVATKPGKITNASMSGDYGNMVEVDHGNGLITRYAHLLKMSVAVGNSVNEGQKIGEVGSTGHSTGNHLHYEILKNNQKVDPQTFALSGTSPIASVSLVANKSKFDGQAINQASAEVVNDDYFGGTAKAFFNVTNNNITNVLASSAKQKDNFDGFNLLFGSAK